jgi:predicted unusual protein kinase regulating ubiquinone biosynthesis (AarF/ABC1/UbiB family)
MAFFLPAKRKAIMAFSHPLPCLSAYIFQISVDVVGLVDEWAARFFEELDYVNEGENGILFAEMMRKDLPQVSFNSILLLHFKKFVLISATRFGETHLC